MRSVQARTANCQRPGRSTVNVPAHRSLPSGDERLFAPPRFTGASQAHRAAERVVPVLEDGRVDLDPVADRALDRVTSTVEGRLDRLDLDAWLWALGKGHSVKFSIAGSS